MSTHGWTQSSFCSNGGCVEVAWISSSFCAAGDCIEALWDAGEVDAILVRDAKLGEQSPVQSWTVEEWQELLRAVRVAEHPLAVRHVGVNVVTGQDTTVVLLGDGRYQDLTFDLAEWEAFCRGVEYDEFHPEALADRAAASEDQPAAQPAEATDTAVSAAAGAVNANTAPAPNSPAGRSNDESRSLDGSAKPTAADQPGPSYGAELEEQLRIAERQRDSLARRLSERYQQLEEVREALAWMTEERDAYQAEADELRHQLTLRGSGVGPGKQPAVLSP